MYVYIYIYMYTYILLSYMYVCVYMCIYIYIYIHLDGDAGEDRRVEEDGWARGSCTCFGARQRCPSIGGFLNNRLCSYTGIFSCNEINGMYFKHVLFRTNIKLFRKPPLLGPPLSLPDSRFARVILAQGPC